MNVPFEEHQNFTKAIEDALEDHQNTKNLHEILDSLDDADLEGIVEPLD